MAEFLIRGWNVAIPEVDIGKDIFVVHAKDGILRRVQVKTSKATSKKSDFSAYFAIPLKQLSNLSDPFIHYVFMVRLKNGWSAHVKILQDELLDLVNLGMGTKFSDRISLYFAFSEDQKTLICSGKDLSKYISDFSGFPIIAH